MVSKVRMSKNRSLKINWEKNETNWNKFNKNGILWVHTYVYISPFLLYAFLIIPSINFEPTTTKPDKHDS